MELYGNKHEDESDVFLFYLGFCNLIFLGLVLMSECLLPIWPQVEAEGGRTAFLFNHFQKSQVWVLLCLLEVVEGVRLVPTN